MMPTFSFEETIAKLRSTPTGHEASMYGPIRDMFINVFRYPASDVDIDTAGEDGRPDVTVLAPAGLMDPKHSRIKKLPWIVVEAKDEHDSFRDPHRREQIFVKKAKYIGADCAWFVMVEPAWWVIRPVAGGSLSAAADVVFPLSGTVQEFRDRLSMLHADVAGLAPQLQRFREGDLSLIGVVKVSLPHHVNPGASSNVSDARIRVNRKRFFQDIRSTTRLLQDVVRGTLDRMNPTMKEFETLAQSFWTQFGKGGAGFDPHTLTMRSETFQSFGSERLPEHDRMTATLKHQFAKAPSLARLALYGLPAFQQRTGVSDDKLHELFAIETANLILARILLLRFLEDHGFFGEMHYVCNGGVAAFQMMRNYFHDSYAELLHHAYQEGGRVAASVFEETELDWIFGLKDDILSNAIEWALFRFARYDFTTVKGDILTGIYDRFMDRDQRKRLGEFYTPPSIARYIVNHIGITRDSRVLDPACGSGTFLIESYRKMVGEDVDRGAAEYPDVLETFERIGGNDLNTFSAVLAQIQLLWQTLGFKTHIERLGFPDIRVTAQANSLVQRSFATIPNRFFAELDRPQYDAVVGNPPYVRAERSAQALDRQSQVAFEQDHNGHRGISSKLNAYALFLYRALDRWCCRTGSDGHAGKVGFVVPLSLFDSNDTASLRELFMLGGRWTLREIVDLEVIYRDVFDADVYTAIVIAENRPPTPEDMVAVRFADRSCVVRSEAESVPDFALEELPQSHIPYSDLFSPDGRILTRLTSDRIMILHKLWANPTLVEASKPYWVKRRGNRIETWTDQRPTELGWDERHMCSRGLVFRGKKHQSLDGLNVFKAENIVATELQGPPALSNTDVFKADDPGPWRYQHILPNLGYAIAGIAYCPNAVAFNPNTMAFTDTVTLFFPREDLQNVPFDLLLLSNVYVWFYALSARMGIIRALGSHIYPTNFLQLPWSESLASKASAIENIRSEVVTACNNATAAETALWADLDLLRLPTLKQRIRKNFNARLAWADGFDDPDYTVSIAVRGAHDTEDGLRVWLSNNFLDWVDCSEPAIIQGLVTALAQYEGQTLTKSNLLNLAIPVDPKELTAWRIVVDRHARDVRITEMRNMLDQLDRIVGHSLGLSDEDITFIQQDLDTDAFLQKIRPRYPGTITRKQGFRTGLDSETRYT